MNWVDAILAALAFLFPKRDVPEPVPEAPTSPVEPTLPVIPPPMPGIGINELYDDWSNQKHAYHNVRVLCDRAGLTLTEKNLICACIYQESTFLNSSIGRNKNSAGVTTSTDWGLCQINDYFNIGKGKPFPSVEYVVNNPQKAVEWMIKMYQAGKLGLWSSYKFGAYKRWLKPASVMWLLKT